MKKFIFKLLLFGVLLIGVDISTGHIFNMLRDRAPYGNFGRNNYINNQTKDDILIFGSSRAIHHYVPQIIEDSLGMSCYNCGMDGNGILLFYGNFKMITERYSPKVIIYELTEGFDLKENDNSTYLGWIRAFYDRKGISEIFKDVDENEKVKMTSNLYRWNFKFIQLMTDNVHQFVRTEKGYKPLEGVIDYTPGKDNNKLLDDSKNDYFIDPVKKKYMEKLIKECKEKDIKLILCQSPYYNTQTDYMPKEFIDLCEKYKVAILNHKADQRFVTNRQYFKDSSHMNRTGAEKYTRMLIPEIKTILRLQ